MAAQATTTPPDPAPASGVSDGPKSGKLWKLIALAFMVAVIGGECLVALIYLSRDGGGHAASSTDSDDPAQEEHDPATAEEGTTPAVEGGESHDEHPKAAGEAAEGDAGHGAKAGDVEVDLGQFSLTAFQPASNSTLLVDFHLYGTVRAEDQAAFQERFEKHQHRIRDQVIVTVRSAEMADFADPGLGLLKRQILEKSNASLGKRLLRGVMVSEFTLIEQ